jgi:hypothetical protein
MLQKMIPRVIHEDRKRNLAGQTGKKDSRVLKVLSSRVSSRNGSMRTVEC